MKQGGLIDDQTLSGTLNMKAIKLYNEKKGIQTGRIKHKEYRKLQRIWMASVHSEVRKEAENNVLKEMKRKSAPLQLNQVGTSLSSWYPKPVLK